MGNEGINYSHTVNACYNALAASDLHQHRHSTTATRLYICKKLPFANGRRLFHYDPGRHVCGTSSRTA